MLQKSGRLVLWEAMFILELHSAETQVYIAKMFSPIKLETVQVLLTTPDYDWERYGYWVNEGPAILKKN